MKIFNLINDGGPMFMYPILALLILVVIIILKNVLRGIDKQTTISILSHLGTFSLAWGIFGLILGMISAFDAIEAMGDISPAIMAGGLKVGLLTPLFGLLVFMISRLGMVGLIWTGKSN